MNNEETIKYGDSYLKDLISACCKVEEKHIEFVRKAIEALKFQQEYQEKVQKCIERIEKLKEPDFDDRNEAFNSALEESIYIIEQELKKLNKISS